MQSKIIFIVLLMLSFTIVHDTVISIMHDKEHASTSHYVSENVQSQECDTIDQIHAMFHFEALVTHYTNNLIHPPSEKTLSRYSLQYGPLHKEPSYKPPTA